MWRAANLVLNVEKAVGDNVGGWGEYSPMGIGKVLTDVSLTCSWGGVGGETVEGCLTSDEADADADASGVSECEADGVSEGWV